MDMDMDIDMDCGYTWGSKPPVYGYMYIYDNRYTFMYLQFSVLVQSLRKSHLNSLVPFFLVYSKVINIRCSVENSKTTFLKN